MPKSSRACGRRRHWRRVGSWSTTTIGRTVPWVTVHRRSFRRGVLLPAALRSALSSTPRSPKPYSHSLWYRQWGQVTTNRGPWWGSKPTDTAWLPRWLLFHLSMPVEDPRWNNDPTMNDSTNNQSLCETCSLMGKIITPKGSRFLLCQLSNTNPAYPKYPPQPKCQCSGYQERHNEFEKSKSAVVKL